MKKPIKLIAAILLILTSRLSSQIDPTSSSILVQQWLNGGSSSSCESPSTPWAIGGNNILPIGSPNFYTYNSEAGTCNNFPFILKANNLKSVYITQGGKIGINNSSPSAAMDILSPTSSQASLRIYGDLYGNIESAKHLNLGYSPGTDFQINEGPAFTGTGYSGSNRMKIFANSGYVLFGNSNIRTASSRVHITNELNANLGTSLGEHHGILVEQMVMQGSTSNRVSAVRGEVYVPAGITPGSVDAVGIVGHAATDQGGTMGGEFIGNGGSYSRGALGQSKCTANGAINPCQSIGIEGQAEGYGNGDAIAVQGIVSGNPPAGNYLAGLFWGDVDITGDLDVSGVINPSDRKFKEEIKPLTNTLDKIMQLKPSTYSYKKNEDLKDMHFSEEVQMGVIAQELEMVFPTLVKEVKARRHLDSKGEITNSTPAYKGVNYIGLIPVLLGGMQEQQNIITDLKNTVANQQKQLDEQKAMINSSINKTANITGVQDLNSATEGFSLDQNIPNPFTHETSVKYTLPAQYKNAELLVYDLTGKQIASFPVTERGSSFMIITSDKLAAGIYIYSIVADGKIMDSKRMVVAEK